MPRNLFLLGSTGSIGTTTLKVIRKNKKNFKIKLLSTNKNINKIYKQAIEFKVKKVVIFDKKIFENISLFKKAKIKVFSSITDALKNNKNKVF